MGRKRRGRPIDGWINLDKPAGISSAQAVARARWALDAAKAGHAGTLDPFATGVLPIAFGEATKTMRFLTDARKSYRFTVRWGVASSTDDCEGEVVAESPSRPTRAQILAALPGFLGPIRQIPPIYSAIMVNGQRSYKLARAGVEVTLAERTVMIHELELLEQPDADHATFSVSCGKGAYMRALARDLAVALGTRGHLEALRRTSVGRFAESEAISLEKLAELGHSAAASPPLLPLPAALDDIPALALPRDEALCLMRGQAVAVLRSDVRQCAAAVGEGGVVLVTTAAKPVALVRVEGMLLKPLRVFNLSEGDTV
ncbi:MAG: tRNA pseudouridine(55) synthase TruB [Alphaproteobacteria bacterium]|nr:tRNA pseudouridine(55) synthase TruB [Alphaproteobacteria bacterium]